MKKFLAALCFAPWLLLGIAYQLDPPSSLGGLLWLLGIHVIFIGLLIIVVRKARSSEQGVFLGYSASFWIAASVSCYGLGVLTPFLAGT